VTEVATLQSGEGKGDNNRENQTPKTRVKKKTKWNKANAS